ncbi:helix-turn-helix domain-containing protein [Leeuwenhoekiella polynyae]
MLLEKFSINEISNMLGYQSLTHFSSTFKKYFGLNPSKIKRKTS